VAGFSGNGVRLKLSVSIYQTDRQHQRRLFGIRPAEAAACERIECLCAQHAPSLDAAEVIMDESIYCRANARRVLAQAAIGVCLAMTGTCDRRTAQPPTTSAMTTTLRASQADTTTACQADFDCAIKLSRLYSAIANYKFHTGKPPQDQKALDAWFEGHPPRCPKRNGKGYSLAWGGEERIDSETILAYEREGTHGGCRHVLVEDSAGPRVIVVSSQDWESVLKGLLGTESIPTVLQPHMELRPHVRILKQR